MFFFVSKLLDVFLSPYSWALILFAGAIPWTARSTRTWKRRRLFGVLGLLLLLVASSAPFANALAWRLEHSTTATVDPDVVYDAVILLGGIVDEETAKATGQPSFNENVERVIMTHKLLREGKARIVIATGAASDPKLAEYGEAVVLGRQLEEWGIAKDRIVIEDRARNTRENALYVQDIVARRQLKRVLLVTSAFHMARAVECFAAVGMNVDTLPVDYRAHQHFVLAEWIPRAHALAMTVGIVREMAGRVVYRVQGYGKAVP